jgi:pilus assembly protein CpaB
MKRLTPAAVTSMTIVVIAALVTVYFAKMLVAEEPKARLLESSKTSSPEFREIPLALTSLEPGAVVTAAHLGTGRIRADKVEPETLLSERAVVGRVVKERIAAATPIRSSQLFQPGERPPLEVSSGMRAVSLAFSPRGSFAVGELQKGQYVDVYLTPRSNDSSDPRIRNGMTITLLNGVRVLAVGGTSENEITGSDAVNTVTLELTPEQANILVLAREKGEIALSYNPDGKGEGGVAVKNQDRATMDEILGLGRSANSPSPSSTQTPTASSPQTSLPQSNSSQPSFTSETFKGTKRITQQFRETAPITTGQNSTPADGNQP